VDSTTLERFKSQLEGMEAELTAIERLEAQPDAVVCVKCTIPAGRG
jgi:hypothetical protein